MRVFRVELPTGIGPYYHNEYGNKLAMKHNFVGNPDIHPGVREDIPGWIDSASYWKDFYCGFKSIAQYRSWFDDAYDLLRKMNCKLKAYEVHPVHVRFGTYQLVFVKEKATLLREFAI